MAPTLVTIVHNPVTARIINPTKEVRSLVSQCLSYEVPGFQHTGIKNWDGYSSFYSMKKDTFPAGFVRLVRRDLERAGHRVIVKGAQAPEPKGPAMPKVDNNGFDPRYDYQPETMERLVKLKRMIAQVATGGGKSRIFKLCAERLGLPTLFITTRKSLMYQMAEAYQNDLKKPVGILGDGVWEPIPGGVNFAIVDTLASRIQEMTVEKEIEKELFAHQEIVDKEIERVLTKMGLPTNLSVVRAAPPALQEKVERVRKFVSEKLALDYKELGRKVKTKVEAHNRRRLETLEFLKGIGFLCLEEAHEVGSDSFFGIAQACVNAHYRLALTATPFMRDDKAANMRLMAATGPVGIQVSEKMLIDRGILATPYFKFIQLDPPPKLYRSTKWQRAYSIGIVDNEARNRAAVAEVVRAKRYGLTSMLLVAHTRHGKSLEKALNAAGVKTRFIYGADEQNVRQEALNDLGKGVIDCLIGTTILDVGVDVPSVGVVGILGAGKAEVQNRQRIGRGLRAKKSGPNVCFIFDFTDEGNNHLTAHARQRRAIIDQTPGFAERVVKDFDYERLGFGAAA